MVDRPTATRGMLSRRASERDICDRIAYDCGGEVEVYLGGVAAKTRKRGDVVIPIHDGLAGILIEAKTCKSSDYASTMSHAFKQLHDYRSDGCTHAHTRGGGVLPIELYCAAINPFSYPSRGQRSQAERRHEGLVILGGRFDLGWMAFDHGYRPHLYQFWKGESKRTFQILLQEQQYD
jgi:hypothetical protein